MFWIIGSIVFVLLVVATMCIFIAGSRADDLMMNWDWMEKEADIKSPEREVSPGQLLR
jgi:hypothetical protein